MIVFVEKPSAARAFAPIVKELYPEEAVTFLCMLPLANFGFAYPRGMKLKEFPFVSEPAHTFAPWKDFQPKYLDSSGQMSEATMTDSTFLAEKSVIFAADTDATSVVRFDLLMRHYFSDGRQFSAAVINSYDESAVRSAFSNLVDFSVGLKQAIEYGHTKMYFDWNWNVNSLAIFGLALQAAGVASEHRVISKYALQLLYVLPGGSPKTHLELNKTMREWKGSGKYSPEPYVLLGSITSINYIPMNLLSSELIESKSEGRDYQISQKGQEFLSLLHPDCCDPDLPFRLNKWCIDGLDKSKPSIDRYIKTVFGKQKIFQKQLIAG